MSAICIGVDPGRYGYVSAIQIAGDNRIDLIGLYPLKKYLEEPTIINNFMGHAYHYDDKAPPLWVTIESQRPLPRDSADSASKIYSSYKECLWILRKQIITEGKPSDKLQGATPIQWQTRLGQEFPFRVDRSRCASAKSYVKNLLKIALNRRDYALFSEAAYDSAGIAIYSYIYNRTEFHPRITPWG